MFSQAKYVGRRKSDFFYFYFFFLNGSTYGSTARWLPARMTAHKYVLGGFCHYSFVALITSQNALEGIGNVAGSCPAFLFPLNPVVMGEMRSGEPRI